MKKRRNSCYKALKLPQILCLCCGMQYTGDSRTIMEVNMGNLSNLFPKEESFQHTIHTETGSVYCVWKHYIHIAVVCRKLTECCARICHLSTKNKVKQHFHADEVMLARQLSVLLDEKASALLIGFESEYPRSKPASHLRDRSVDTQPRPAAPQSALLRRARRAINSRLLLHI